MKTKYGWVSRWAFMLGFCFTAVQGQPAPAESAGKEPLLVEGEPIVKDWVVPEYPAELQAQKITGDVTVHLIVDETGHPQSVKVAKSTDPRFDEPVIKALSSCTFTPAVEQGRAVAAGVTMTWHYRLPYHPSKLMPPQESYPHVLPKKPAVADAMPEADYPDALIDRQLTGEVLLEIPISENGDVLEPRILNVTQVEFVRPALDSVKRWKFTPAKQGDLAVKDVKRAPVSFVYQSRDATDKRTQLEVNGFFFPSTDGAPAAKEFDVAPVITAIADPVYPLELLQSGGSGDAEVSFTIGLQGLPEAIEVKSASTPACGASVRAALEATAFTPALLHGQAVEVKLVKRHKFSAPSESAQPDEPAEARLLRSLRAGEVIPAAKGLDGKLRPIWRAQPVYPSALKADHPKGTATIEFVIDRAGRVRVPKIISATQEEFGWAAATALTQWVFDPPTRGGQPTDVRVQIPFQFSPP